MNTTRNAMTGSGSVPSGLVSGGNSGSGTYVLASTEEWNNDGITTQTIATD